MTTSPEAAIGQLVPLMYRTHLAGFGLSGEVRSRTIAGDGSGAWEEQGSLEVAPGGRYRAEVIDGEGERDHQVEAVPPPGMKVITGGLLAEWGQSPASVALHAAKGAAGLAIEIGRRWLARNNPAEPGR